LIFSKPINCLSSLGKSIFIRFWASSVDLQIFAKNQRKTVKNGPKTVKNGLKTSKNAKNGKKTSKNAKIPKKI